MKLLTIVLLFLGMAFTSCQSRYGYMPRGKSKNQVHDQTNWFKKVPVEKNAIDQASVGNCSLDSVSVGVLEIPKANETTYPSPNPLLQESMVHQTQVIKILEEKVFVKPKFEEVADTSAYKSLQFADAVVAFSLLGALSLATIPMSAFATMAYVLLIMLAGAAVIFLGSQLFKEMAAGTMSGLEGTSRQLLYLSFLKVRKFGVVLLIISLFLFALALLFALGSAFEAAFITASLAGVTLAIALTCLLISLLASAFR